MLQYKYNVRVTAKIFKQIVPISFILYISDPSNMVSTIVFNAKAFT